MTISYRLGRCLLALRLSDARMTQADLAIKTGLSSQQLSDYANNRRRMSLANAIAVAEALRCETRDLYELIPYRRRQRK